MANPLTLADELAALSESHRAIAECNLQIRAQARELAQRLSLDESDVYHQLQQLARSPGERLRIGLAHGRLRPRIAL